MLLKLGAERKTKNRKKDKLKLHPNCVQGG